VAKNVLVSLYVVILKPEMLRKDRESEKEKEDERE
jgi:hypothetical protein